MCDEGDADDNVARRTARDLPFLSVLKRGIDVRVSQRTAVIIDEHVLPTRTCSSAELQVKFKARHGRMV
jgi:hypothetical protein